MKAPTHSMRYHYLPLDKEARGRVFYSLAAGWSTAFGVHMSTPQFYVLSMSSPLLATKTAQWSCVHFEAPLKPFRPRPVFKLIYRKKTLGTYSGVVQCLPPGDQCLGLLPYPRERPQDLQGSQQLSGQEVFSSFTLLLSPCIPFHLRTASPFCWNFYLLTQLQYLKLPFNYSGTTVKAN